MSTPTRNRAIVQWVALAAAIHAVPLFFPRNEPKDELTLARMIPSAKERVRLLEPLLDNSRSTPEDLRDAAELVLGDSTGLAERLLGEARRRGSEPLEAELLLARICRARGDGAGSFQALDRARRLAPRSPRPDVVEAGFRQLDGDGVKAVAALQRAHGKSPGDDGLALELARALASSRREDEGRTLVEGMKGRMPEPARWIELGKLSLAAGEVERAAAEFDKATSLDPKGAKPRFMLGAALFQLGDYARAEPTLRYAAHLDPNDFQATALLCALMRESLRLDEAAILRRELQSRFPERAGEFGAACPP